MGIDDCADGGEIRIMRNHSAERRAEEQADE